MTSAPAQLGDLTRRVAELQAIHGAMRLLSWDKSTYMPPEGAAARGDQLAALERISHERLVDPELARLLDALEPWADGQDPDGDDVRLLAVVRRDHARAVAVPADLAAEMARAGAVGEQAWLRARMASDFAMFRDALAHQVELSRRYAACFPEAEHPYDPLLDVYEPHATHAQVRPLLEQLSRRLVPLIAAAAPQPEPFPETVPKDAQRAAIVAVLTAIGFDPGSWRIDETAHPFCQMVGHGDYRITTRYRVEDFGVAFYGALHEFGHGLYDEGLDRRLASTPLHGPVSLGVHESQSRLWENVVGRGLPFLAWLLPQLRAHLGPLARLDEQELYRRVNGVQPSLIRVEADEATYNLHVVLRFEIEVALLEGRLEVDGVPEAWGELTDRLLGLEVPDDAHGALQDIHWSLGAVGYFPTYAIGNLMAAQLWNQARADIPALDEELEAGRFSPLREWLREHIHRHGRKFPPRELLRRATGSDLEVEPFVSYLEAKLSDAGVVASRPAAS